jgi:hypothetical protein
VTEPPEDTSPRRPEDGRPTLLTPELQERIVRVVRAGNYLKTAAQFCGIGESTLRLWLQRGRAAAAARDTGAPVPDRERPYLDFLEAVTQGGTAAEVAAVTHWRAAFADDWRAARDFLRYSKPDTWSPVTRVQLTPEDAERRIEEATLQVLTAVGVDSELPGGTELMPGDLDPETAALDGGPLPGLAGDEDDFGGDDF